MVEAVDITAMRTPAQNSLGTVLHKGKSARKTDYLYRISLKCLVRDSNGDVLVVKEAGRDWWDLPGGGMDHGESIADAIAREMKEEVNLKGGFDHKIIHVEEPAHLVAHNFWQLRLIFEVATRNMSFSRGDEGDAVAFVNPASFKKSESKVERRIYTYSQITAA